jgi:sulfur relay protein TusB/DsrH
MRILHIVKNKIDTLAFSMAKEQALANDVSILLLHDAVLADKAQLNGLKVFACTDDVLARGIETQNRLIDYQEIVNLVFDSEKVISW